MKIENVYNRDGYKGVMLYKEDENSCPVGTIFVWCKNDGTGAYISVTADYICVNGSNTFTRNFDDFASAMNGAIAIFNTL